MVEQLWRAPAVGGCRSFCVQLYSHMWDIGTEIMKIRGFYKNISSVCNNITFQYDFQIELHEFSFKIIFKSDMLGI